MPKKKLKIAFLDRDGVVNKNAPSHEYITKIGEFVFNPGIFQVLTVLKEQGYEFIVLTNQQGVARGFLNVKDLKNIHKYMREELERHGLPILDIFFCPHKEDTCDCRKPKPGLLKKALTKYNIDLSKSIYIGDSESDKQLAKFFDINCVLVSPDHPEEYLKFYYG